MSVICRRILDVVLQGIDGNVKEIGSAVVSHLDVVNDVARRQHTGLTAQRCTMYLKRDMFTVESGRC